MVTTSDRSLLFTIQLALRKALKMVRGLRKEISERDERVMAAALAREIGLAYDFEERPPSGHVIDGPNPQETKNSDL